MKRGARRAVAVVVVLVLVVTVFVLFVGTLAPVIGDQIRLITENAPRWLQELRTDDLVQQIDRRFDVVSKVEAYVSSGDFGQTAFGGALGVGLAVVSVLANTLIVLVLMIYFLSSLPSIKHALYSLAPASRRPGSASSATGSSARPGRTSPARSWWRCAPASAHSCSPSSSAWATTPSRSPSWSGCSA